MNLNTTKLALTIPMMLLLGVGALTGSKVWAWGDDGGCCFGGGFHYWHHFWFHHWGCGYGWGYQSGPDFNQGCCQPDDNGPQTSSNQGTTVNVNSPGAEVNTYQSASAVLQPIIHGLCALTQVNCGYQGPSP